MSAAFSSCVPCDMLMRTPSMPAANIASNVCWSRDAGPIVASIFALFKIVLSAPHAVAAGPLSNQERNDCRHLVRVVFKLCTEHFTQQFLFTAHANGGAHSEHDNREQETKPVADCQASCQQ